MAIFRGLKRQYSFLCTQCSHLGRAYLYSTWPLCYWTVHDDLLFHVCVTLGILPMWPFHLASLGFLTAQSSGIWFLSGWLVSRSAPNWSLQAFFASTSSSTGNRVLFTRFVGQKQVKASPYSKEGDCTSLWTLARVVYWNHHEYFHNMNQVFLWRGKWKKVTFLFLLGYSFYNAVM